MAQKRTFRPKKDHEGMRLVVSLPDSAEDLTVSGEAWPYETESPSEQAALEAHPWITDRPETSGAGSSAKTSNKEA